MLTPEVEQWLTRFAAGAGTVFVWTVTREGYLVSISGGGAWAYQGRLCPVSAQATLDSGTYYARSWAREAALQQRLSVGAMHALFDAADDPAETAIRPRLLHMCRLTEERADA